MIITPQALRGIYTAFNTVFNKAFEGQHPTYEKVATVVPSTSESETYAWLGDIPGMREWIGEREIQNLSGSAYTIKNKDFELTVGVDRNAVEDDKIGLYNPSIQMLGESAALHPDELVYGLLANGFTEKCYDGKAFFATDHPVGKDMIVLRIKVEVIELLRVVLNNMFVSHAGGAWLDLKMADYSKKRKKAQKTQGFITVRRADMTGEAVKIPKGHVFKSILDINGEELRFFVLEAATLQKGASSVDVLVEAETEGSRYNVPAGQIVRTLTYLGDVTFSNAEDWIVREGSDTEDDESARARTLRSWSELAQRATEDTFIDAAESVPGVLFAQADCNHPRGQGTVDVIVTGTAGEATEGLLAAVREAVDKIAGPYDNILVKSSVTVSQNISVTVTTDTADTDEAVENRVKAILTELLAVRRSRKLNELTLSDINHAIRSGYSGATNAAVSEPEADVKLGKDKVITLGDVSVTVERE